MAQNDDTNIGNDLGLKNVLVTRFSALGNVVMTIPVIYSACLCYPEIRFMMVTRQSLTGLFINRPTNLEVIGIDLGVYHGAQGARHLCREMRQQYSIDAYVDLQNDMFTTELGLFCKLHGIKVAHFNKALNNKRELTRKTGKVMLPLVSERARYRATFFAVGLPIEQHFDSLYGPGEKADPSLYACITTEVKHHGQKWIGIAPFAAHTEKEYPLDKMDEVIRMLIDYGVDRIFVFGGDGREQTEAQKWHDKYPQVVSLAGSKFGFPAEMALLSNLDAMLTMDSANMHMASIVGTPTVSVWGATHQYCGFKGWRQSEADMVQLPLSCRPCSIQGDKDCYRHDLLCLTAIRPETIYAKTIEKLTSEH